jgi:hypothetical protein
MATLINTHRYFLLCVLLMFSTQSLGDLYGPSTSSGNFTLTWDPPIYPIYDHWLEQSFEGGPVQKYYPDDHRITFNKTTNGTYDFELKGRGTRCSGGHEPICNE